MAENTIITRTFQSVQELPQQTWNALLSAQTLDTPFMRHEYLAAMEQSGSATPQTGWICRVITLWQGQELLAACPIYVKTHSYGEYVFDWSWARAYEQHSLPYYPKGTLAVPFTPVPGTRLLVKAPQWRLPLVQAVQHWAQQAGLSSLHLLFGDAQDLLACEQAGWMLRSTVQFHWRNVAPTLATACAALPPEGVLPALGRPGGESVAAPTLAAACAALPPEGVLPALGRPGGDSVAAPTLATACAALPPEGVLPALGRPGGDSVAAPTLAARSWRDFDDFLASLNQEKRKKIRQERRKVREAGVGFKTLRGAQITPADWAFFYRCYERTYLEHGNPPYLTPEFFKAMQEHMAENWVLFIAERDGLPIASSLIAISDSSAMASATKQAGTPTANAQAAIKETVAYGRYWGALERVDCLHFEACYYQPIEWCIANGIARFEGGAQGEHKMARALLPVVTPSAHWIAHPAFADAIGRFLERESKGMAGYVHELQAHSPLRQSQPHEKGRIAAAFES